MGRNLQRSKSRAKLWEALEGIQELRLGGTANTAKILFANIPEAGEQVIIGGYYFKFQAAASEAAGTSAGTAADPHLVTYDVSLSLAIDALMAQILAETATTGAYGFLHPNDTIALVKGDTNTSITFTFYPGEAGNNIAVSGDAGDETITQPASAVGKILFANIPAAGETITIGDYTVEFTADASDETAAGTEADPILVNIKGSLSLTIDELITVLKASVVGTTTGYLHPQPEFALTKTDTNTSLTIKFAPGSWAESIVLAGSAGDETITQPDATIVRSMPRIDLWTKTSRIDSTLYSTTNLQYYYLPDGDTVGQEKTIIASVIGSSDTPAVVVENLYTDARHEYINFAAADDFVKLTWTGNNWIPIVANGVTYTAYDD